MNLKLKQLLSCCVLLAAGLLKADCNSSTGTSCGDTPLPITLSDLDCTPQTFGDSNMAYGQTFFSIRPQYSNVARDQMGTSNRIHKFAVQEFNGDVSLALDYAQSTKDLDLGTWFFFNGSNTMSYGPNWTPANYGAVDVNSLNFAVTASGTITASPRIQNFVADFQLYLGWDEFVQGLWTRLYVPVNWVRTDMRLIDTLTSSNSSTYLQGDVDNEPNGTTTVVYNDLQQGWVGDRPVGDFAGRAFGNINGRDSITRVAGLVFEFGYDFLRRERGHCGVSLRIVAPTGNEPNANVLFEPVSGANGCWEVGMSFTGAYQLYTTSTDSQFNFYVDGNITHLGSRAQKRLMGLKNIRSGSTNGSENPSPGASWLLLEGFDSSDTYNGSLISAADALALVVKVGNAVMADIAASFEFRKNNYGVRVGYNFWDRSKEKASARQASIFADANYAIKAAPTTSGSSILNFGVSNTCATKANSNISSAGATVTAVGGAQYLTEDDIAVCPALHPQARSNKVFGCVDYTWNDNEWTPYLLLGGSYEIGASANEIKNSALTQWSVLAKGGIAF
jgi:hypothetical protein